MGRRTGAVMLSSAADIAPAALQCGLLVDWHAAGQGERFIDDSNAFCVCIGDDRRAASERSEEHTSELQSLMRISYAVFCLKKKKKNRNTIKCEAYKTNQ